MCFPVTIAEDEAGPFVMDWATFQPIVYAAIGAALSYIIKNYFTNSTGELMKGEPIN